MKVRRLVSIVNLPITILLVMGLAGCGGGGGSDGFSSGVVSICDGSSSGRSLAGGFKIGKDGTINGATWTSLGRLNGALDFDGIDDYVDLGTWGVEGNSITIALWFKANDFDIPDARLISKATGTFTPDHYFMLSTWENGGMKLRFRLQTDSGATDLVAASGTLTKDVWIHAVAVYDGAEMRLYKDGVEVGNTAKTGVISTNDTVNTRIGNNPVGPIPFDGLIDDVRVYDRALDQTEIQALAAGAPDTATRPLAHWTFDEGSGGTAFDILGTVISPNTAILTWDAVTAPDLSEYRIYCGTLAGTYLQQHGKGIDAGNVTTYAITELDSRTRYYFAVTAVDTSDNESGFSNEVFKDIP